MTEKGKDGEQKREMANDKTAMGRRREIQRIYKIFLGSRTGIEQEEKINREKDG